MIDRIEKILRNKGLSHSHFADEIGVQRSSVSHVMSGRNKPSLDFVRKILNRYPEVNAQWLVTGKENAQTNPTLFEDQSKGRREETHHEQTKGSGLEHTAARQEEKDENGDSSHKKPVRIIMFYADHSFEEYFPGD